MPPPTCNKCDRPATHSMTIREGVPPFNPSNPKTPDKSVVKVLRFCDFHWDLFHRYWENPNT